MSIFLNPVVFSVILMCILCLCKLNVMFSLIIACFVGGLMGGMSVSDISSTMLAGFSNNAEAALAYCSATRFLRNSDRIIEKK